MVSVQEKKDYLERPVGRIVVPYGFTKPEPETYDEKSCVWHHRFLCDYIHVGRQVEIECKNINKTPRDFNWWAAQVIGRFHFPKGMKILISGS